MYKVLFVSHGSLCEGLKDAVNMILGSDDGIECVSLNNSGIDDFKNRLANKIKELRAEGLPVLVLADLFGGTPFNSTMMEISKDNGVKVVAGVNLAMAIEAVANIHSDIEDVVKDLVNSSKSAILEGIVCSKDDCSDE